MHWHQRFMNFGAAVTARIPRMTITTMSSMSVKPAWPFILWFIWHSLKHVFLFPDAVIPVEYMPEGQSLHYSYTASEDSVQLFSQSRIADKLPASYDYRLILSSIKGISVRNVTFLQFIFSPITLTAWKLLSRFWARIPVCCGISRCSLDGIPDMAA